MCDNINIICQTTNFFLWKKVVKIFRYGMANCDDVAGSV